MVDSANPFVFSRIDLSFVTMLCSLSVWRSLFLAPVRQERAAAAMKSAGASVLTGITLTKLVGVSVLAIAPSLLFRVYYFRMYIATVFAGAFQVQRSELCSCVWLKSPVVPFLCICSRMVLPATVRDNTNHSVDAVRYHLRSPVFVSLASEYLCV